METQNTLNSSEQAPAYLKVLAFLFPLFVMYGPVNDEVDSPANRELWSYLLAGLITEVLIVFVFAFTL